MRKRLDVLGRRSWIVKLWWVQEDYGDDVRGGFTRGDSENLNTFRVGRVVLAWGLAFP